jgi:hypothetical protein
VLIFVVYLFAKMWYDNLDSELLSLRNSVITKTNCIKVVVVMS